MDITPSPAFVECVGRAMRKHGKRWAKFGLVQTEMLLMLKHKDSVTTGLATTQEKHRAVAQVYPDLYQIIDQ